MFNLYPEPCRYCGGTIPPERGTVEKVGESWRAAHLSCAESKRREIAALGWDAATLPKEPRKISPSHI